MMLVLNIVGPVFGVVLMGFFATRWGYFSEKAANGLSRFVFDFAIPILLFRTFVTTELPENLPIGLFVAFYVSALIIYAFGVLVSKTVFKRDLGGAVIAGFGSTFGNSIMLGIPLVLATFGPERSWPFFALLSVHGLSLFTVTTILLESSKSSEDALSKLPQQIVKGLVKNPIILGILAGLIYRMTALPIWEPVDQIASLMQNAVAPCSLFALGASLTKYGFAGHFRQSLIVTMTKVVLFPLLVFVIGHFLLGLPHDFVAIAVLMAALPTGVNAYLFAERYENAQALATSVIFISMACSLVTLPIVIGLILM